MRPKEEVVRAQVAIQKGEGPAGADPPGLASGWNDALAARGGPRTTVDIMANLDIDDRLEAAQQTIEREEARWRARRPSRRSSRSSPGRRRQGAGRRSRAEAGRRAGQGRGLGGGEVQRVQAGAANRRIHSEGPSDGFVVYANDPVRGFGSTNPRSRKERRSGSGR